MLVHTMRLYWKICNSDVIGSHASVKKILFVLCSYSDDVINVARPMSGTASSSQSRASGDELENDVEHSEDDIVRKTE